MDDLTISELQTLRILVADAAQRAVPNILTHLTELYRKLDEKYKERLEHVG